MAPEIQRLPVEHRGPNLFFLAAFRLGIDVPSEAGPLLFRDRDTLPPRAPPPKWSSSA